MEPYLTRELRSFRVLCIVDRGSRHTPNLRPRSCRPPGSPGLHGEFHARFATRVVVQVFRLNRHMLTHYLHMDMDKMIHAYSRDQYSPTQRATTPMG